MRDKSKPCRQDEGRLVGRQRRRRRQLLLVLLLVLLLCVCEGDGIQRSGGCCYHPVLSVKQESSLQRVISTLPR